MCYLHLLFSIYGVPDFTALITCNHKQKIIHTLLINGREEEAVESASSMYISKKVKCCSTNYLL